jgi:hypothetical protein
VGVIAGGEEEVRAKEWEEAEEKACGEEGRWNEDGNPCCKACNGAKLTKWKHTGRRYFYNLTRQWRDSGLVWVVGGTRRGVRRMCPNW